jgi:hypothetical protein
MHACIHTYIHTYMSYSRTKVYTYIHTYIGTYIHIISFSRPKVPPEGGSNGGKGAIPVF